MNNITMIPVEQLHHHPENPRLDLGDLTELTESIKKNGIMQNLTVVSQDPLDENFLATLTFIHDYWKNHSFDSMDLCKQLLVIGEIQVKISMRYSTYPQWLNHFISSYKLLMKI